MRFSAFACVLAIVLAGCGGGGGGSSVENPLPEGQKGTWTVLVYMNAANDLYPASTLNVNQMEAVSKRASVRFVVQWKQSQGKFAASTFNGTRRYLVYPDSDPNIIRSKLVENMGKSVDMGSAQTLTDFVTWGKAHYPADHYILVIWNHGNGWERRPVQQDNGRAISYDDATGHAIQTWELDGALSGLGMDIIAMDASLMQMAEVVYSLKNCAPLIVGSEESPPAAGYPYDEVFAQLVAHPELPAAELSQGFVSGMLNDPDYVNRKITQSVIDTSKLTALATACSSLANTLVAHPELSSQIQAARSASQAYSVTTFRHYYDLMAFCQNLNARTNAADVVAASTAVQDALTAAIVHEGHNSFSAGSRGLAIDLSSGTQFSSLKADYQRMNWAADTSWDEWLLVAP